MRETLNEGAATTVPITTSPNWVHEDQSFSQELAKYYMS